MGAVFALRVSSDHDPAVISCPRRLKTCTGGRSVTIESLIATSGNFRELAPSQIVLILAEQGIYVAS